MDVFPFDCLQGGPLCLLAPKKSMCPQPTTPTNEAIVWGTFHLFWTAIFVPAAVVHAKLNRASEGRVLRGLDGTVSSMSFCARLRCPAILSRTFMKLIAKSDLTRQVVFFVVMLACHFGREGQEAQ